jgi:3-oxoacyl-[acyl-carrier protein] reductase
LPKLFAQVTGAGRGLGKEIAIVLAAKGCTVVLVDLDLASVQSVAAEIVQNGGKAVAMECDIADEEGVVQLKRQVEETVGLVGILVNNAGMIFMQNFMKTKLAHIERVVTVNVVGMMFVSALKILITFLFKSLVLKSDIQLPFAS